MEKTLFIAKVAAAAASSGLSAMLGIKGILALVWLVAMALDYVSGTAAAMKAGQWSSRTARTGLWHKAGNIFAVSVGAMGDLVLGQALGNIQGLKITWPGAILPLVLTWYIFTELGSILENAVKLGAAVPKWLVKLLRVGLSAVDHASD